MQDIVKHLQRSIDLNVHTTMALPARAQWFARATSLSLLIALLEYARAHKLRVIILGQGSNALFIGDQEALVIQIALRGLELREHDAHTKILIGAAGERWDRVVQYAIANELYGIENLSWIPGTLGAAPVQNIGAYGVELEQVLAWVEVLDRNTLQCHKLSPQACQFGYRESIFKQSHRDQLIITRVALRLSTKTVFKLEYKALAEELSAQGERVSLASVRAAVISVRQAKLPEPAELPNAGSFFKNPVIDPQHFEQLQARYPHLPGYQLATHHYKVPAAWLIDQAGWKGRRVGLVGVHSQQALVLVNYGVDHGQEVIDLADQIKHDIHQRYAIRLEIEPRIYHSPNN